MRYINSTGGSKNVNSHRVRNLLYVAASLSTLFEVYNRYLHLV